MSKPVIRVENLSKQYRLGNIGTGSLSNDLKRWWHQARGKEDPFLRIGETNDRTTKGDSEYVWALKDINFEVMPGEILGIIGKNGAGKSTLLKILSKVTGPTTGRIDYNGRIGSLLEVGTGFHLELTGRENIFLNGAILGMTKHEIRSKLDEIIDFSGCERYIDTPVKRYSSGMTVRLGFAVAAHLEPEILVVDEVLAVGDAEFQKKAIGKMQDVSRNDGRTVLFVSHNMGAVQTLCTKAVVLSKGTMSFSGDVRDGVDHYLQNTRFIANGILEDKVNILRDSISVDKIKINNLYESVVYFDHSDNQIALSISGNTKIPLNVSIEVMITDAYDNIVASYSPTHFSGRRYCLQTGPYIIQETIPFPDSLANGEYLLSVSLSQMNVEYLVEIPNLVKIVISENINKDSGIAFDNKYFGYILLDDRKN